MKSSLTLIRTNGVATGDLTAGNKRRRLLEAGLVPLFCLLLLMTLTAFSPAQAAITQVGTPTYYSNNWWSYTLQLNVPSGIQVGDVLIAQVSAVTTTDTTNYIITPPSGWTEIRTDSMTVTVQQNRWSSYSYNIIQGVYYRVVDGTEGSHYTWTTNFSGNAMGGGITTFRGVDPTNPIDASGGQTNTSSKTITAPSITTSAAGDALVGLLFTTSLAVGVLTIPNDEIIHSLFGAFPALSPLAFIITTGLALAAAGLVIGFARQFLFRTTTPDLAQVHGLGRGFDLLLLSLFALIVSLGIKLVGTLLMGALTIIPASIAKNIVRSMKGFITLSTVLGGVISVTGLFIAHAFSFLPGPSIILFGVGLFLVSLALPRRVHS